MTPLPIKTYADITALRPCYSPARRKYYKADWTGTALDVLKHPKVPVQDKLWLVFQPGWIDDRTLRLFAVWCARQAMTLVADPDPRSLQAIEVAERFAWGQASSEELAAAWAAARAAAWAAARAAAWDAAWAAAWDAAWDAQVNQLISMLETEPTP